MQGQSALQSGELDVAEKDFRQVLAIDPQNAGSYANLGVIAMRRKQWSGALTLLHKAERLAPSVAGIRLNIGLVHYREGDFAGAIAPFQSVVRDQPESQQARHLLGLCQFFITHYADAATTLEPLFPQASNDLNYLYVLGIAAANSGRTELSEKALGRLVEVGQDAPEFHLLMAKALLNRQEDGKALAELQQAQRKDPRLPFLHFNLGVAYLRQQDYAHAEAEFLEDITLEPDVAYNYEQLGVLYSRLQQDQKAERYFREAIRRDSRLANSQFGLAEIYLRQAKYDEGLAAIAVAEKQAPDNEQVHYLHARLLAKLNRRQEAATEFATAKRLAESGLTKAREHLDTISNPQPELEKEPQ